VAGGPGKLYRIFRHLTDAGDFLRASSAPGRLTTVGADDEETASGTTSETASEAETIDK